MTAPVLDSLAPATAPVGTPLTVTILGSGFTATDIVVVEGADAPGTFVDDVSMTFDLPADAVATLTVSVRNDLAEVSNALVFLVEEAEQPPVAGDSGRPGNRRRPAQAGGQRVSPNTPAQAAVYMAPEPPDVYQAVANPGPAGARPAIDGRPGCRGRTFPSRTSCRPPMPMTMATAACRAIPENLTRRG